MFEIKKKLILTGLIGLSLASASIAQASGEETSQDPTVGEEAIAETQKNLVPLVNPKIKCPATDMSAPGEMRAYTFLNTNSCYDFLVLPPKKVNQGITPRPHPNLASCKSFHAANDNIHFIDQHIQKTNQQIFELTSIETEDIDELGKIESRIELLEKRKKRFIGQKKLAEADKKVYDEMIGAEFHVVLDSSVKPRDRHRLAQITSIPQENNGQFPDLPEIFYIRPKFTEATIENSIFSFDYYSPQSKDNTSSIMKSNIPGLQILQQEGSNLGTAHVKGKNALSGFVSMRLSGVCGYETDDGDGTYSLLEDGNPIFTVNQTYEVQQQFKYGYTASLKTENIITKIIKETIEKKNNGFTKEQMFRNVINSDMSSVMVFEWNANHSSDEHNFDGETVQQIKASAFAEFVDRLFDNLVEADILEIVPPSQVANAEGGYLDVSKTGTRCWIERKWYGRRRKKCNNYTYKVKEWRDGLTEKDLQTTMTVTFDNTEVLSANVTKPFYFTTTFEPTLKN